MTPAERLPWEKRPTTRRTSKSDMVDVFTTEGHFVVALYVQECVADRMIVEHNACAEIPNPQAIPDAIEALRQMVAHSPFDYRDGIGICRYCRVDDLMIVDQGVGRMNPENVLHEADCAYRKARAALKALGVD